MGGNLVPITFIHIAPLRYILSPSMRSRECTGAPRPCGCVSHARAHDEAVLPRDCPGSCRGVSVLFRCALAPFVFSCKFAQEAAHPFHAGALASTGVGGRLGGSLRDLHDMTPWSSSFWT